MSIKLIIVPWLELLIDALWKNKNQMMKDDDFSFDYPDYGGLPVSISNQLMPEHVDFLQENIIHLLGSYRTKKQFARKFTEDFSNNIVSVR